MLQEQNFTQGRNHTQSTVFLNAHKQGILWAVVFNSRTAKIFEKNTGGFDILYKLTNDPDVDDGIDKDSIGSAGAYGSGRHGYEPSMEESRQIETGFIRSLSDWLAQAGNKKKFDELVLIGPPRVLGMLREELPDAVSHCIRSEENKDLINHPADELEKMLLKLTQNP